MQLNFMIEQGEVVELVGEKEAKVKVDRRSQCMGCPHKGLCDPFGSNFMVIRAKNYINAKIGDKVEVQFSTEKRTKAILVLYIIPLILFFLGVVIGNFIDPFKNKDLSSSILGIVFLLISFAGIYLYNKILVRQKPSLYPIITRKV